MPKKMFFLISFVLGLCIAVTNTANADPSLVGWWRLDEGSGTTAYDSSGNGRHGTFTGDPEWVAGKIGGALQFDGQGPERVLLGTFDVTGNAISITCWFKADNLDTPGNDPRMVSKAIGGSNDQHWFMVSSSRQSGIKVLRFRLRTDGVTGEIKADTTTGTIELDTWIHVATTWDGVTMRIYKNGVEVGSLAKSGTLSTNPAANVAIGNQPTVGDDRPFSGLIDDVRIYTRALTPEDIAEVMKGISPALASNPSPAYGAIDVPRDVVLSWTPGEFVPPVNGHKVYLSDNFADVNDGIGGIATSTNSYAPVQRLDFDKTYYWRVDEVNGSPDYTVYQGDVWQFTTEPIAYPIAGENITATASSSHQTDMGPENTINGSGLDDDDLHSNEQTDMWLSSSEPLGAWIQYEFDKVCKLHQMWIWNSNQTIEPLIGFGLRDVTIEYSTNGTDWTRLDGVPEFAQAPGAGGYVHNTTVDLGGAVAKYVRLTANSNWGGIVNQYGLSEVRFFHIPVHAREPYPDLAVTGVDPDVVLGWRAGREAATHDVYLSTDEQAVIDGIAPVTTVTETSYGPLSLDLGTTYYWRVDEVNEAEIPATWQGAIWDFTTKEYFVVDDFESYNDLDPGDPDSNRIFNVWIDGYEQPPIGSLVGYDVPPFTEQSNVHSGEQAMPFFFSNTGSAVYSEAERTFAVGQDWTKHGVKTLSLWFAGAASNTAAQMYVKVNGSKVTYDGDASNLKAAAWQPWNIELASSGADLQNVTKLSIGIDGIGATGTLLFDDIRLYPYSRQLITPTEPGNAALVAHYKLDQNASDSSGNGHNGTVEGAPTWSSPGWDGTGSCMQFGGDSDRITVESFDLTGSGITLSAWIKPSSFKNDARMISKSQGSGTPDHYWAMILSGNGENNLEFRLRTDAGGTTRRTSAGNGLGANEWTHVAVTWDASDPYMRLYKNGREIDSVSKAGTAVATGPDVKIGIGNQSVSAGPVLGDMTRPFDGLMDEVRIYNRTVSVAEMAWLAGRTKPIDKPF
ncbi:MAG: LamG-like jellyroll fold domain-containing protein [Planctomycetota bacterium]|jgi:hypothetical protein